MRVGVRLEVALFGMAALFFVLSNEREVGAPGFVPTVRGGDVLRVVTWNVGGSRSGEPHGFRDEYFEPVAATLVALDPDLVFLQELDDRRALERLARRLGTNWTVLQGRRGVATLSARGPIESWSPPRARSVGIDLTLDGHWLSAVALHAAAFSAEERNREIGPSLDALLERPADIHLFAGDLNLDLDLDKRGDLFSNDQHLDVETYNYVASALDDAARGRGATAEPDRRLDYLFVSSTVSVKAAGPWRGRRVGSMDHDPLVADLELPR